MRPCFQQLTYLALCVGFAGCANLTSPARHRMLWRAGSNAYWFDYSADRRGAILIPSDQRVRLCAEPSPDVALNQTTDLVAKATVEEIPVELQAKLASQVVELAGRTQMVLFLRESMYRLCEQGLNGNLKPAEIRDLYARVVEAAVALAHAELASQVRAVEDPDTRRLLDELIGK